MKSERELLEGTINNTAKIGNKVDLIFEQNKILKNQVINLTNNQQILDRKLNDIMTLLEDINNK
jgi:hypothetical protein